MAGSESEKELAYERAYPDVRGFYAKYADFERRKADADRQRRKKEAEVERAWEEHNAEEASRSFKGFGEMDLFPGIDEEAVVEAVEEKLRGAEISEEARGDSAAMAAFDAFQAKEAEKKRKAAERHKALYNPIPFSFHVKRFNSVGRGCPECGERRIHAVTTTCSHCGRKFTFEAPRVSSWRFIRAFCSRKCQYEHCWKSKRPAGKKGAVR